MQLFVCTPMSLHSKDQKGIYFKRIMPIFNKIFLKTILNQAMDIYHIKVNVKLVILATTPRSREGRYSFPLIAPLYP